jgi:tetratricopeptide (TPR) repeat protein
MSIDFQLRSHSVGDILDAAFLVCRTQAGLLRRVALLLLPLALFNGLYHLIHGRSLDWADLSPLHTQVFIDAAVLLRMGLPLDEVLRRYGGVIAYHLIALVLLAGMVLTDVGGAVADTPRMFARPALPALAKFAAGLLTLLPITILTLLWVNVLNDLVFEVVPLIYADARVELSELLDILAEHVSALIFAVAMVAVVTRALLASPAASVERLGVRASVTRSVALTRGVFRQVFQLALTLSLIGAVVIGLPVVARALLDNPLVPLTGAYLLSVLASLLAQAAEVLVIVFDLAALVLLYYSRRVRVEGYDLTVRVGGEAIRLATEHFERARELIDQEHYRQALTELDAAIGYAPGEARLWFVRAGVRGGLKQYDRALADAERAVALDPGEGRFLAQRGTLRDRCGDQAGARADMEATLRLAPDSTLALDYLASMRYRESDLEGALELLERLLTYNPAHERALYNSACIYARWKRTPLALERLACAIAMDPHWREDARDDRDFDAIRDDPQFQALMDGNPLAVTAILGQDTGPVV